MDMSTEDGGGRKKSADRRRRRSVSAGVDRRRRRRSSTGKSLLSSSVSRSKSFRSSRSCSRNLIPPVEDASDSLLNQVDEVSNNESVIEQDFAELKEHIINGIGDFESALNEFIEWKNEMMENNIPSNMKLEVTLLFSRLFRRYLIK